MVDDEFVRETTINILGKTYRICRCLDPWMPGLKSSFIPTRRLAIGNWHPCTRNNETAQPQRAVPPQANTSEKFTSTYSTSPLLHKTASSGRFPVLKVFYTYGVSVSSVFPNDVRRVAANHPAWRAFATNMSTMIDTSTLISPRLLVPERSQKCALCCFCLSPSTFHFFQAN